MKNVDLKGVSRQLLILLHSRLGGEREDADIALFVAIGAELLALPPSHDCQSKLQFRPQLDYRLSSFLLYFYYIQPQAALVVLDLGLGNVSRVSLGRRFAGLLLGVVLPFLLLGFFQLLNIF